MNPKYEAHKKNHILYDEDVVDHVDSDFFDPAVWSSQGKLTGSALGRGTTVFIRDGEHQWVLRHYRRGGFPAHFSEDRYLWPGLERTRPWREWHLLAELHRRGLPVPAPVAAQVVRHGIFYSADIVSSRLEGRVLSVIARERELDPKQWISVGACIRRFHDEGVFHADLNAHNILVDGNRVSLIDFDRGALRPSGPWKEQTLERLRRSLRKLQATHFGFNFSDNHWQLLLSGYGEG